MSIKKAESAGFCFGVNRAINIVDDLISQNIKVCTLGPIIHNMEMVRELKEQGCRPIDDISELCDDETLVIRSHGVPKSVIDALEKNHINYKDATCPFVKKIHNIVAKTDPDTDVVLIAGNKDHPEVQGIIGNCNCDCYTFNNGQELDSIMPIILNTNNKSLKVIAQTTFDTKEWKKSVKKIKKLCTNSKIFDTICNATDERQHECAKIAGESDVMLILGDSNSSNTQKLKEVAEAGCANVHRIDGAWELDRKWFENAERIGITAGASTPAWIIKEVVNKMSEELKNQIAEEVAAEETVNEAANEVVNEAEENFEQLLEGSIKTLYTGDKVTGIVTAINSGEINVDLGVKQAGYIPVAELSDDPNYVAEGNIKVGDEIEAFVMRVNDVEGTVQLSKKRLDMIKGWDSIEAAREERTTVEGTVIEENKGGVVVSVNGVHVFVPASQTGLPKDTPMTELLKQKVRLRIIEVNRARRRVVGSIRVVAQEERRAKAEQIWNEIEENKVYEGVVKSLTSYGAFVDIGGVDGMIHISELSWTRVRHPSDVVSVGDKVEVYVISFDREKRKISLGYRKAEDNPWMKFISNYGIGDVVPVKVLKFMPFGAFAEVLPGVDGLIHISQIANQRINKPDDVLTENEVVNAKITDIDTERQKISLSIRALIEEGEAANRVMADEPQNETVYVSDEE